MMVIEAGGGGGGGTCNRNEKIEETKTFSNEKVGGILELEAKVV